MIEDNITAGKDRAIIGVQQANLDDRSRHSFAGEVHAWSPTGHAPECLKGVVIPADVFAATLPHVRALRGNQPVAGHVIQVALHETGHAIPWVLNGGRLKRTTIIPKAYDGGILWGECRYEIEDVERLSMIDRHRLALAAMGSSALCELAGNSTKRCTTSKVLSTTCSRYTLLVAHGTIEGFPPECISTDNSPIAGLAEALAKSLSSPCDWLLDYLKYK